MWEARTAARCSLPPGWGNVPGRIRQSRTVRPCPRPVRCRTGPRRCTEKPAISYTIGAPSLNRKRRCPPLAGGSPAPPFRAGGSPIPNPLSMRRSRFEAWTGGAKRMGRVTRTMRPFVALGHGHPDGHLEAHVGRLQLAEHGPDRHVAGVVDGEAADAPGRVRHPERGHERREAAPSSTEERKLAAGAAAPAGRRIHDPAADVGVAVDEPAAAQVPGHELLAAARPGCAGPRPGTGRPG